MILEKLLVAQLVMLLLALSWKLKFEQLVGRSLAVNNTNTFAITFL